MFKKDGSFVHSLDAKDLSIPKQFTFPFYYEPHPLSIKASEEIQTYLELQRDFKHNFGLDTSKNGLSIGKMFGVMIVEQSNEDIGYLAAFSGKLAESNFLTGFVPPIYDTLNPDGFYKKGESRLNAINDEIEVLECSQNLNKAKQYLDALVSEYRTALDDYKRNAKTEKKIRKQKRLDAQEFARSNREALFETLKEESIQSNLKLKYLKREYNVAISKAENALSELETPIKALKDERKHLSASLQGQIHEQYHFLNAKGETKSLLEIFKYTTQDQPPAAAGECAAPKLFQFAYQNNLKPIAMAEFWWGISPNAEVRKHKQFYPSCRGKCEPILGFMMHGLKVAPNPMEQPLNQNVTLDIIFEDDYLLLVNKPNEFLSVPGKVLKDSVLTRMKSYLPDASGPLLVHRLDMSTSGLLLVAKNEKTYKNLQKQFIDRSVRKRYVALLDGELSEKAQGFIDLPLRVDLNNRPRQLVCYHHGRSAKTKYKVDYIRDGKTRIYFYPISGRTHQLRVHAAHHKGLNIPIVGDDLYGKSSNRLHLHAEYIAFEHPVKKERIEFECKSPF